MIPAYSPLPNITQTLQSTLEPLICFVNIVKASSRAYICLQRRDNNLPTAPHFLWAPLFPVSPRGFMKKKKCSPVSLPSTQSLTQACQAGWRTRYSVHVYLHQCVCVCVCVCVSINSSIQSSFIHIHHSRWIKKLLRCFHRAFIQQTMAIMMVIVNGGKSLSTISMVCA